MDFENDLLKFSDKLKKVALKLTRNLTTAEDLLQETYLVIYEHKSSFKEGSNFMGWAYKIMLNKYRDDYRKGLNGETSTTYSMKSKYNRVGSGIGDIDDFSKRTDINENNKDNEIADSTVNDFLKKEIIERYIKNLPSEMRSIIELKIKGFKTIEISQKLNMNHGFVRYKLYKLREMMRKSLNGY